VTPSIPRALSLLVRLLFWLPVYSLAVLVAGLLGYLVEGLLSAQRGVFACCKVIEDCAGVTEARKMLDEQERR
jgi:hypothetical protein